MEKPPASPWEQATFPPTGAIPALSLPGDHFISTHCNWNQELPVPQREVTLYQHGHWHPVCHQPLPLSKRRAEKKQELLVKCVSIPYHSFLAGIFLHLRAEMLWLLVTNSSRLVSAGSFSAPVHGAVPGLPTQQSRPTQRVPAQQLPTELPTVYRGDIHLY